MRTYSFKNDECATIPSCVTHRDASVEPISALCPSGRSPTPYLRRGEVHCTAAFFVGIIFTEAIPITEIDDRRTTPAALIPSHRYCPMAQ
jgi:hypothetical protein